MTDVLGLLKSLIEEYAAIDIFNPTNHKKLEMSLCKQLDKFDRSFSFSSDFNIQIQRRMNHVFFNIPLIKWAEWRVQYFLLVNLGRSMEAELARAQSHEIRTLLPGFSHDQHHCCVLYCYEGEQSESEDHENNISEFSVRTWKLSWLVRRSLHMITIL